MVGGWMTVDWAEFPSLVGWEGRCVGRPQGVGDWVTKLVRCKHRTRPSLLAAPPPVKTARNGLFVD
jgi:hypothetical protein